METKTTVQSHHLMLPNGRMLSFGDPLVMGILNCTPDSFFDGGKYPSVDDAVFRALEMIEQGADIVDVGGESTRPGSAAVSVEEELQRVVPVIAGIRKKSKTPISIDTTKAAVAKAAVEAGADIINDISALRFDSRMTEVVRETSTPVVLMHMQGTPAAMQIAPTYEHVVEEIHAFFAERIEFCIANGIEKPRIVIDPGIGFGKRLEDNLAILANLGTFTSLGCPILIGLSRKSFIGKLVNEAGSDDRLGGSIAGALLAVQKGASIVRVHDVAETAQALRMMQALQPRRSA